MRLLPCPRCVRHVFVDAAVCPFCSVSLNRELHTSELGAVQGGSWDTTGFDDVFGVGCREPSPMGEQPQRFVALYGMPPLGPELEPPPPPPPTGPALSDGPTAPFDNAPLPLLSDRPPPSPMDTLSPLDAPLAPDGPPPLLPDCAPLPAPSLPGDSEVDPSALTS